MDLSAPLASFMNGLDAVALRVWSFQSQRPMPLCILPTGRTSSGWLLRSR